VLVGVSASRADAHRDKDCADFPDQATAQHFFDSHGPGDPDGLDGDHDGVACELNPCPCADPGGGGDTGGSQGLARRHHARVAEVTDGDTVDVRLRSRTDTVRIIGIDTPEVYFGAECGGAQASRSMHQLLQPGDRVKLIRDRSQDNRDRYGRLLRYVQIGQRDVGRAQVRRGWASVYVYETPFVRVPGYRRAQQKAHRSHRGVWRRCSGDFHQPL
jgi:endonuclease YncB( thermonuclease family)